MTKHRNIIAGLASVAILLLAFSTTHSNAVASPKSPGLSISQLDVLWRQNPPAWPTHKVEVEATYVNDVLAKPIHVSGITLSCGPNGSGGQGPYWGSGINVNGTNLEWGGYNDNGLNVQWQAPYGGNIPDCQDGYGQSTTGDDVNSSHHPRIVYSFTTNYGSGQGNVSATIAIDIYGPGSCQAHILSGPGYLGGGANGCTATAVQAP